MRRIERDQVLHVARLARLALAPEELDRLATQMASILAHFEELAELEPEAGSGPNERGLAARTRDDEPHSDPLAFGPHQMAPDWRQGYFVVPRLPALAVPSEAENGVSPHGSGPRGGDAS